jgi:N-acetyl-anhydromuramoyl-L-alanine amidase
VGRVHRGERRITLDVKGLARGARFIRSPNCDERPPETKVALVVIHNISLPPGEFGGDAIIQLFTNTLDFGAHPFYDTLRGLRVSAHFLVRRTGELLQFVLCSRRAWHAGVSSWCGRPFCNDFSLGIALEGTDLTPYAEEQYRQLTRLALALEQRYPIRDIVGHSDIAPTRKTDPGPAFDWDRFRVLRRAVR